MSSISVTSAHPLVPVGCVQLFEYWGNENIYHCDKMNVVYSLLQKPLSKQGSRTSACMSH